MTSYAFQKRYFNFLFCELYSNSMYTTLLVLLICRNSLYIKEICFATCYKYVFVVYHLSFNFIILFCSSKMFSFIQPNTLVFYLHLLGFMSCLQSPTLLQNFIYIYIFKFFLVFSSSILQFHFLLLLNTFIYSVFYP